MKIYYVLIGLLAVAEVALVIFSPVPAYTIIASSVAWCGGMLIGWEWQRLKLLNLKYPRRTE